MQCRRTGLQKLLVKSVTPWSRNPAGRFSHSVCVRILKQRIIINLNSKLTLTYWLQSPARKAEEHQHKDHHPTRIPLVKMNIQHSDSLFQDQTFEPWLNILIVSRQNCFLSLPYLLIFQLLYVFNFIFVSS